ncbi:two-component system, CitB family, response regulator CitT [Franzmannia pantelleriensis]|uniref:Transcriptional regulatory protein n=1 Tax=Franzmannia pantelleriensis TaxID=48727 RepID=A0A1G9UV63_9GAMM|nr:response regulator [Halomonas pantelleriensis]SDM63720.1 two-component system, CitB family, response regulator CitT [Halomonas pantelleriensis]
MSEPIYGILIVEDDFRIADINRAFIEQSDGFEVVGMAKTGAEALAILEREAASIHLVLLDAYIPDVEGLELLWEMRRRHAHLDIVMITAAKEVETIAEALRGGVFDYLIKPTESERMAQMLRRFREERAALDHKAEMSQEELDRTLGRMRANADKPTAAGRTALPKGIDRLTLGAVVGALSEETGPLTAMQLATRIGASRSTARRYLEFLVSVDVARAELGYGDVGRPERRYRLIGRADDWLGEGA